MEVGQQLVHGRRPRPGRTTHRPADAGGAADGTGKVLRLFGVAWHAFIVAHSHSHSSAPDYGPPRRGLAAVLTVVVLAIAAGRDRGDGGALARCERGPQGRQPAQRRGREHGDRDRQERRPVRLQQRRRRPRQHAGSRGIVRARRRRREGQGRDVRPRRDPLPGRHRERATRSSSSAMRPTASPPRTSSSTSSAASR